MTRDRRKALRSRPATARPVAFLSTPQRGVPCRAKDGAVVASALLPAHLGTYSLPPWVHERAAAAPLRWRVEALDLDGERMAATEWREFTLAPPPQ